MRRTLDTAQVIFKDKLLTHKNIILEPRLKELFFNQPNKGSPIKTL